MKKIFAAILAIAMLVLSVAAIAERNNAASGSVPSAQMQGGPRQGRGPMGQSSHGRQNGQALRGERPAALPEMNGQTPGSDKPADLPETNGQVPGSDMPAYLPEMNGQAPGSDMPAGLPEMSGQASGSDKPADLPEMNGQASGSDKPAGLPEMSSQAPGRIDFDAMVSKGIISEKTCNQIKAYMEEHKPADLPEMNGGKPAGLPEADGQAPLGEAPADLPEMNGEEPAEGEAPATGGLLSDLLKDGIITQSEYEALAAAQ